MGEPVTAPAPPHTARALAGLLVLLVAGLATAGCIGTPSTKATAGDRVVYDLRFSFDGAVVGLHEGFEAVVPAEGQPVQGFRAHLAGLEAGVDSAFDGTLVGRERVFGPFSALGEIGVQGYIGVVGRQPTVGDVFEPPQSLYRFRVEAVQDQTVAYRAIPDDGQRDDIAILGAELITDVDGDELLQTLEPKVGAFVAIPESTPFQPAPLGLPEGEYVVAGANGTHLFYWSFDAVEDEEHDDAHDATATITLRRIERNDILPPLDGNLGVRDSPQLKETEGDDAPLPPVMGQTGADDHQHGEGEADHEH